MDEELKAGDTVYELNRHNNSVLDWPIRHITNNVVCVGLGGTHIRYFNLNELGGGRWFRHYPYTYIIVGTAALWLGRLVGAVAILALIAAALIGTAILVAVGLRLGGL